MMSSESCLCCPSLRVGIPVGNDRNSARRHDTSHTTQHSTHTRATDTRELTAIGAHSHTHLTPSLSSPPPLPLLSCRLTLLTRRASRAVVSTTSLPNLHSRLTPFPSVRTTRVVSSLISPLSTRRSLIGTWRRRMQPCSDREDSDRDSQKITQ